MAEKPSQAAASAAASAAPGAVLDAHELGERLRALRGRVDELRGRL